MSIAVMSRVWKTACASHTQKLVLLALADNANDKGECWPSVDTIAAKCDLSRRAVQYELRRLTQTPLLTIIQGGGRGHSHRYHIHTGDVNGEQIAPISQIKSANGAPNPAIKGANHDERVQITTIKGASRAPEPSGTVKEPRGRGRPLYVKEFDILIKTAEREIDRINARGLLTDKDRAEIKSLHEQKRQWTVAMLKQQHHEDH